MKRIKILIISIFIIFNFMMMLRAQINDQAPIVSFIYRPATFVQNYFSMWRGWNMFAPNPLQSNSYIDAKIIFTDESEYIWEFPRPSKSDFKNRYFFGERFRKYAVDGLRIDSNSHLWPDAARFVLKNIAATHFKKIPLKVILRRRWKNIPHWNDSFIAHNVIQDIPYEVYEFYTYEVK